jgi:type II secretory pathway pseudopilin PulG
MKRGEAGSALIEAMVGAAIVAGSLAAMYAAIYESSARNRMAEARRTAMMIAQSELAAVGSIIPAAPGITEGTEGDFYWRVDIEPYGANAQPAGFGTPPSAVGILCVVKVLVGDQRRAPLANLTSLTLVKGA